jgi:hypothetical protein
VNSYPMWWDTIITVYNKYNDPTTRKVTWCRSIVPNCFWKYTENKLVVGETTIETSVILCRVPISKQFLEKYKWDELSETEKENYFTFGLGDIIVKGQVADEIDEYTSGSRSSDVLNKYKNLQGCAVVQQCSINAGVGRGNEHYLVKGV